jgi:hypothetical protein
LVKVKHPGLFPDVFCLGFEKRAIFWRPTEHLWAASLLRSVQRQRSDGAFLMSDLEMSDFGDFVDF